MDRRTFIGAVSGGLIIAWSVSNAQQTGRIYRIGYLQARAPLPERENAFRQGLKELGWIEGQNISIEYRYADAKLDKLRSMASELVGLNVDIILTSGTTAVRAARDATATIPIVMASGEPVSTRLVASLARPGGNITGLTHVTKDLIGKRLQLLKETVPNAIRVAAILNPQNPGEALFADEMESTAQALGLYLLVARVSDFDQIERTLPSLVEQRAQGLMVLEDPVFTSNPVKLAELVAHYRLPAVYGTAVFARSGGLMSYGANFTDLYRRAALYVDKILKGAKPADLPIEQPTKFELVINLNAAKTLGLTIPQSLRMRADQVVQ